MRLLVSVASPTEADAALRGGANLIDAKDPSAGPLGAVSIETLRDIHAIVGRARPVTAALGDASDDKAIERLAFAYGGLGTAFVKIGFAAIASPARVAHLIKAAARGAGMAGGCGVVAVAYADAERAGSLTRDAVLDVAADAGALGILLDTADKTGPGLRGLVTQPALSAWVESAHEAGLLVAVAGKLTASDATFVRDAGADIAGFRGAACEGTRIDQVSIRKVRALGAAIHSAERLQGGPQRRNLVG